MTDERTLSRKHDMETTPERYTAKFIARLGDLKLGNPDGIPSAYAEATPADLEQIAEATAERMVAPTDITATACIDGRRTLENKDGSKAEIRLRRVGGSASNLGVALNAEASIVDTLEMDAPLLDQAAAVDGHIEGTTGFQPSAHEGGCGGANGEVGDNQSIHDNPAILEAVKTFMAIPEVRTYLATDYSEELAERVRANAGKTAQFLQQSGWKGQDYVDRVGEDNPRAVEVLEVDHEDHKFHGHKEKSLIVILGDATYDGDDDFVWNLKASKAVAEGLAGQRGHEGYTQALIAELAKHFAVANRLPSDKTPIQLVIAEAK